jgi:hypothetical protein
MAGVNEAQRSDRMELPKHSDIRNISVEFSF